MADYVAGAPRSAEEQTYSPRGAYVLGEIVGDHHAANPIRVSPWHRTCKPKTAIAQAVGLDQDGSLTTAGNQKTKWAHAVCHNRLRDLPCVVLPPMNMSTSPLVSHKQLCVRQSRCQAFSASMRDRGRSSVHQCSETVLARTHETHAHDTRTRHTTHTHDTYTRAHGGC